MHNIVTEAGNGQNTLKGEKAFEILRNKTIHTHRG